MNVKESLPVAVQSSGAFPTETCTSERYRDRDCCFGTAFRHEFCRGHSHDRLRNLERLLAIERNLRDAISPRYRRPVPIRLFVLSRATRWAWNSLIGQPHRYYVGNAACVITHHAPSSLTNSNGSLVGALDPPYFSWELWILITEIMA